MACILNSELCPLLAYGWHALAEVAVQCRSIVRLLAGLFDGVAADSEPTNTTESDTDTDTENYSRALS